MSNVHWIAIVKFHNEKVDEEKISKELYVITKL